MIFQVILWVKNVSDNMHYEHYDGTYMAAYVNICYCVFQPYIIIKDLSAY